MNTPCPAAVLTAIRSDGRLVFDDGTSLPVADFDSPDHVVIFAVRHGEKAHDGTMDPPLATAGEARAERLGKLMAHAGIDHIFTTPFVRTRRMGEAVQRHAANRPPLDIVAVTQQNEWLDALLAGGGGKRYFYAGHQHTVPALLNALLGERRFTHIPDDDFSRMYLAVTSGQARTEVLELRY